METVQLLLNNHRPEETAVKAEAVVAETAVGVATEDQPEETTAAEAEATKEEVTEVAIEVETEEAATEVAIEEAMTAEVVKEKNGTKIQQAAADIIEIQAAVRPEMPEVVLQENLTIVHPEIPVVVLQENQTTVLQEILIQARITENLIIPAEPEDQAKRDGKSLILSFFFVNQQSTLSWFL